MTRIGIHAHGNALMRDIDGSFGEGGGQLVRTAVALAAITGTPTRVRNVRVRRPVPGLAPQHVAAVNAVAALCDGRAYGAVPGSLEVSFEPGRLRGGAYRFDIGTAGSISLVLQALLPVMLAAGDQVEATVTGGTDVRGAPPIDYLFEVLLRLLARAGATTVAATHRRGYYPRGGGEVRLAVQPVRLRPLTLADPGRPVSIRGISHAANLPAHIAERMRAAAIEEIGSVSGLVPDIEVKLLGPERAEGSGGAIVAWAETESTALGSAAVAQRGIRAEALGANVGAELRRDLVSGATLDVHAADQILVYLALAGGASSYTAREVSAHARTAMWLIEQFFPVKFALAPQGSLTRVDVVERKTQA
jgi:RNA 3'-phosphate cyclase